MFRALGHRNYFLLWAGNVTHGAGDWMDTVALNWLVLELTGSAATLGLVNLGIGVPLVGLALVGGVAADRFERRRLVIITQFIGIVLALALALMVWTRTVEIWQLLIISILRGLMIAIYQPARQALIPDLVPRHDLLNAMALNSATFNTTRILGPAVAGAIISLSVQAGFGIWLGMAACFAANGLAYLPGVWGVAAMELPPSRGGASAGALWSSLAEVWRHLRADLAITWVLATAMVMTFLGQPYMFLVAVFAHSVLFVGASGMGLLLSSSGIGALAGSLALAVLDMRKNMGPAMLGTMMAFSVALILFSASPWFGLSLALAALVGATHNASRVLNTTMLQLQSPAQLRGRLLSFLSLERGLVYIGTMVGGVGAEMVGPPLAMGAMAGMVTLAAAAAWYLAPSLRRADY